MIIYGKPPNLYLKFYCGIIFPSPRYSTFLRVYTERWADVLKFRDKSLHLVPVSFSMAFPQPCKLGKFK